VPRVDRDAGVTRSDAERGREGEKIGVVAEPVQQVWSGLTMYSTSKRSNSHFDADSTPGYSVVTRQLRKIWTPPVTGGISGVVGAIDSLSTRGYREDYR
jgi:hypothetical protein